MKSKLLAILCALSLIGWSHAEGAAPAPAVAAITIGESTTEYTTLEAAFSAVETGQTITLLQSTELASATEVSGKTLTIDLAEKTLTFSAEITGNLFSFKEGAKATFKDGTIDISGVQANANANFQVADSAQMAFENVALIGKNYKSPYAVLYAYNVCTGDPAIALKNCTVTLENDLSGLGGFLKAENTAAKFLISGCSITLTNPVRGIIQGDVTLENSSLTITGEGTSTTLDNGINSSNLTVTNSIIVISNGSGRGLTLAGSNTVSIDATSSVSASQMAEGAVMFKDSITEGAKLTVEGTLTMDQAIVNNSTTIATDSVLSGSGQVVDTSLVAQIGERTYTSLAAALAAAESGQTVKLLQDIALTAKLTVNKGVTLDGAGKTVTATGLSPAFEVTTGEAVRFENLTLTGAKRAIFLSHGSDQVTLVKCRLVVSERGIHMVDKQFSQVVLTLNQTIINQEQVTEENKGTQVVYNTSSRGLSLWNMKQSVVTLENGSEINGFSYAINVAGTQQAGNVTDTTGLTVKVIDSTIRSWAALNVLGSGAHYEVTRSTLLGINTSSNSSNNFATIVFDHDNVLQATNNTLLLADSTVTNYQGGTCLEQLLRVDGAGHQITFSGTVNLIDTTGKIEAALDLYYLSAESYKTLKASGVTLAEGATVTCKRVIDAVESELPLWPSINVKYYWKNSSGGYTVRLCDFFEVLHSEKYDLCDGEFIDLIDTVPLTEDLTISLYEGAGSFTLNLGDYAFEGSGHLLLPVGISVVTDKAASTLFAAADPEYYQVVEEAPVEEGGQYTYSARPKAPVAEVNGATQYASLEEAIAAAKSGDTITLLQDVTVAAVGESEERDVDVSGLTIDLNGKVLGVPKLAFVFYGTDFTIKNGTLDGLGASYALWIGCGEPTDNVTIDSVVAKGGANIYAASNITFIGTTELHAKDYYAVWADEAVSAVTLLSGSYYHAGSMPILREYESSAGAIKVQGGLFTQDPSAYCAEGYSAYGVGMMWEVREGSSQFVVVDEQGQETAVGSLEELLTEANVGKEVHVSAGLTEAELAALAEKSLATTGPAEAPKDATEGTGLTVKEVAEVLGGAFTVSQVADAGTQTTETKLVYHYNFGVAGLEVNAPAQTLSVVAKLVEGEVPADRTLVGRTLQVVLTKGDGTEAIYGVANPVFDEQGECRVAVPWAEMTQGTNAIQVRVVK